MKTITFLTTCLALACSLAQAAPASKPTTKPATSTPPALVGLWESVSADGKILPGTIELRNDGKAVLAPKGETRLQGTWKVEGHTLFLVMPPYGTAQMQYSATSTGLTLTYENGSKQKFTHQVNKK